MKKNRNTHIVKNCFLFLGLFGFRGVAQAANTAPLKVEIPGASALKVTPSGATGLSAAETKKLVELIDERQRSSGDYNSTVFIDQKDKDGSTKPFEATVYRRDADDKWMIIFTKPKAEAGKGYLRVDKNLFLYDPAARKWERQTERASIAGTGSRRDDFDESRLAQDYEATYVGEEKLQKFKVHHLKLTAKAGADVASPLIEIWVDVDEKNVLKRQDSALSGKLLRTSYYPSWEKMFSKSKNAEIYVPKEIRVFDEVEKGASTTIAISNVKLEPLEANLFTKAWIETKSK